MLYINYGVPKSGSTLTFEMTWKLLELAGHRQFNLSAEARNDKTGRSHYTNSVRDWTPDVVAALEEASPDNSILLVRTHHAASDSVAGLINRGIAKHMVGLRDPRDIALSMLDVVVRLGEKGRSHNYIKRGQLETTFQTIDTNVSQSTTWANIPGALILDYEQTAFSHEMTLDAICAQLGIEPPKHLYPSVFDTASDRLEAKKNVARPYRHRREMSIQDQQMFLDRYAEYYARFFPDATVEVEEDDEHELAVIAARREIQRQREVDRKERIAARAAKPPHEGRGDRQRSRQLEGVDREERKRFRQEKKAERGITEDAPKPDKEARKAARQKMSDERKGMRATEHVKQKEAGPVTARPTDPAEAETKSEKVKLGAPARKGIGRGKNQRKSGGMMATIRSLFRSEKKGR